MVDNFKNLIDSNKDTIIIGTTIAVIAGIILLIVTEPALGIYYI